ncbi:PREDICTED: topoisomerase I damage affected protein 7-like [Camelina sativa]|uniref:Topoisomerase I damage affected protein 7-like n=1 Tax=Camelina sativa TaxID=90675 RepID=A0ABM0XVC0_CAMSA|nr:PREDICTED: topoisomerase I damage affected protein 7-like [Camelina sativa]
MLPLKLARSLLLHETLNLTHNSGDKDDGKEEEEEEGETSIRQILSSYKQSKKTRSRSEKKKNTRNSKTPLLYFVPTRELISDTYRLATVARDLGMDLYPTPSLSHIIFSFPPRESKSPSPSPFSSSSQPSSTWSSSASLSSTLSWSLPNDAVMLSFPSLSASSLSHLRSFVSLSNGLFKLVFSSSAAAVETSSSSSASSSSGSVSNWDCCSVSLFSRIANKRIGSMESFSNALASNGWSIYKTKVNHHPSSSSESTSSSNTGGGSVYLFRKVYTGRIMNREGNGSCRVRELRLSQLDFRNAPLRILQYLMLMTDDIFFLP